MKALFVYNSNPAAVAPNQNAVLRGLRREDLFTVVHEQFFTDTADYADILLPAPTFLETKDVQGAYGHLFVQVSERAIEPLGEARNNVRVFGELGRRMFGEACFDDREDALIDQALSTDHPWFAGVTRERLEREGQVALALPADEQGRVLPFSTAVWFRTASGRGELLPVPEFCAPVESRAHAGAVYPLEFLPRKADNYMNSTFANQPVHQRMETATAAVLEMHADDAQARGIAAGELVEIFNARGSLTLRATLSGKVGKGVVAARLDWAKLGGDLSGQGANVNALTSERLTDLGGGATFYSTLVEVRAARAARPVTRRLWEGETDAARDQLERCGRDWDSAAGDVPGDRAVFGAVYGSACLRDQAAGVYRRSAEVERGDAGGDPDGVERGVRGR